MPANPNIRATATGRSPDDARWGAVDRALKRFGYQQDALIEVLHTAQEAFGYLPDAVLTHIAQQLRLPFSWVYGAASFYHFFSFQAAAPHTCIVCTGTACYVEGARTIIQRLEQELDLKLGQRRDGDRLSLTEFRCPGSCGLAPIVVLDGEMIGQETAADILERIRALLAADRPAEAVV